MHGVLSRAHRRLRRTIHGRESEPRWASNAIRREFTFESSHDASPEELFPLLCPVREYDWIDGWRCEMVHSKSGVAEEDCIFTTEMEGLSTWVVTRYEPPARIEFCILNDQRVVARLKIEVETASGGGSRVVWRRIYTALGRRAERFVDGLSERKVAERMRDLTERLDHYLRTGERLSVRPFGH